VAKPNRESFLGACARLGVAPEQTMLVGDVLDVDAVGACAAGLHGVWLDREESCRPCAPALRVGSLDELLEISPLFDSVNGRRESGRETRS
jgi:putative hydrolase of the HAD superfamily